MIFVWGYFFYYIAALIGISIGYHRYFSHRAFQAGPITECVMLFFGLLCGGRSPLTWAAVHRMHHAGSDTEHDPHSPKYAGAWKVISSQWTVSHIPRKFIADLVKNPRLQFFHRHGRIMHVIFAICIWLLLGISGLIIFVVMPYALAWFSFGFLNWITHRNGEAEDVPFMNILAPGEGWHKYHHEHPRSHTLNKYDIAGWTIERIFDRSKHGS